MDKDNCGYITNFESAYNVFSILFHILIEFPLEYDTFNITHINSKKYYCSIKKY